MKVRFIEVREAKGEKITSPETVIKLMGEEGKADREAFWVLHLNTRNKIIEKELVSLGIADSSLVHPREVFKKAILNGAVSIITVHNHPSGDPTPSEEDIEIWARLEKAGKIIGIEVIDNIIITPKGEYYSQLELEQKGGIK